MQSLKRKYKEQNEESKIERVRIRNIAEFISCKFNSQLSFKMGNFHTIHQHKYTEQYNNLISNYFSGKVCNHSTPFSLSSQKEVFISKILNILKMLYSCHQRIHSLPNADTKNVKALSSADAEAQLNSQTVLKKSVLEDLESAKKYFIQETIVSNAIRPRREIEISLSTKPNNSIWELFAPFCDDNITLCQNWSKQKVLRLFLKLLETMKFTPQSAESNETSNKWSKLAFDGKLNQKTIKDICPFQNLDVFVNFTEVVDTYYECCKSLNKTFLCTIDLEQFLLKAFELFVFTSCCESCSYNSQENYKLTLALGGCSIVNGIWTNVPVLFKEIPMDLCWKEIYHRCLTSTNENSYNNERNILGLKDISKHENGVYNLNLFLNFILSYVQFNTERIFTMVDPLNRDLKYSFKDVYEITKQGQQLCSFGNKNGNVQPEIKKPDHRLCVFNTKSQTVYFTKEINQKAECFKCNPKGLIQFKYNLIGDIKSRECNEIVEKTLRYKTRFRKKIVFPIQNKKVVTEGISIQSSKRFFPKTFQKINRCKLFKSRDLGLKIGQRKFFSARKFHGVRRTANVGFRSNSTFTRVVSEGGFREDLGLKYEVKSVNSKVNNQILNPKGNHEKEEKENLKAISDNLFEKQHAKLAVKNKAFRSNLGKGFSEIDVDETLKSDILNEKKSVSDNDPKLVSQVNSEACREISHLALKDENLKLKSINDDVVDRILLNSSYVGIFKPNFFVYQHSFNVKTDILNRSLPSTSKETFSDFETFNTKPPIGKKGVSNEFESRKVNLEHNICNENTNIVIPSDDAPNKTIFKRSTDETSTPLLFDGVLYDFEDETLKPKCSTKESAMQDASLRYSFKAFSNSNGCKTSSSMNRNAENSILVDNVSKFLTKTSQNTFSKAAVAKITDETYMELDETPFSDPTKVLNLSLPCTIINGTATPKDFTENQSMEEAKLSYDFKANKSNEYDILNLGYKSIKISESEDTSRKILTETSKTVFNNDIREVGIQTEGPLESRGLIPGSPVTLYPYNCDAKTETGGEYEGCRRLTGLNLFPRSLGTPKTDVKHQEKAETSGGDISERTLDEQKVPRYDDLLQNTDEEPSLFAQNSGKDNNEYESETQRSKVRVGLSRKQRVRTLHPYLRS